VSVSAHPSDPWPALPLDAWRPTCETVHMWSQIVGKIRLALSPPQNHWWHAPLYVTSRGLTTSPIPWGTGSFEIQFDFIDHRLEITLSDGRARTLRLGPIAVADFYDEVMATLRSLGVEIRLWPVPVEVSDPIRFTEDRIHAAYDPEFAGRFWRVLLSTDRVFKKFRGGFVGKASPVHFFWGSFDLAVTRFSGRPAPERPGADPVTREAYSHEVISAGFWPGSGPITDAAFYAYAVPQPEGFSAAKVRPSTAFYEPRLSEFLLMYDDVRRARSPEDVLLDFLTTTYEAAATLAGWDRAALERAAVASGTLLTPDV
jgi:uncharacterized protein DUF5996